MVTNQKIEQLRTIGRYQIHPACEIFPDVRGGVFDALVNDIKKKGLILPIILYEGMVIDGKNRYRACLKINVAPVFMDYKGKLSAIDLATSLNSIRRHSNPAKKAEIAVRIMKFFEDEDEEAKFEEALEQEDERTAEKIRVVRDKKKMMAAAERGGTTSEKVKQRIVIERVAKNYPDIKRLLGDAEKGKVSMDSVYRKAVKRQEAKAQGNEDSEVSDVLPKEKPVEDTRPVLVQNNEKLRAEIKDVREEVTEWKDKYHNLKAIYESLEQKHKNLKDVFKNAFESAGLDVESSKKENPFPKPKELREAGLKY